MFGVKYKKEELTMGFIYFFIHLFVEIISFGLIFRFVDSSDYYIIALVFDVLAFIPQAIIGEFYNNHKGIQIAYIGISLLLVAIIFANINKLLLVMVIFLSFGNAILHICGAVATVKCSSGKIFSSALFVGGGSFGLIIGQVFGKSYLSLKLLFIPLILILILVIMTNQKWCVENAVYPKFDVVVDEKKILLVIIVAFFVTAVRSFIGYAIPISWKKELYQSFLLYFTMGFGKAIGGFLCDKYGYKNVACLTTILCIPFLIAGENLMFISIIGVMMFSMTMSITFAMLLSVLPNRPGFAFGITTVALIIGFFPTIIFKFDRVANIFSVIVFSILSCLLLKNVLINKSNK